MSKYKLIEELRVRRDAYKRLNEQIHKATGAELVGLLDKRRDASNRIQTIYNAVMLSSYKLD